MIYNRSIEGNGSLPPYKAEVTIMLKDTAGYIALPNLPPRAALLTAPNLRTVALTQAVKNPTRRMIPMTMAKGTPETAPCGGETHAQGFLVLAG